MIVRCLVFILTCFLLLAFFLSCFLLCAQTPAPLTGDAQVDAATAVVQGSVGPSLSVRVFVVSDAATFPSLRAGKILVFRNGLFQAPGRDYDVLGGQLTFRALANGDRIAVVTLP